MKLSLEWLGQYVDIPKMSSKDIALELTMKTAEVEEVYVINRSVNGIIVGEITAIEPIDTGKSDKAMNYVTVDLGSESLKTVCGAPNVQVGMKSAFAPPGAIIADSITIKEQKVFNYLSQGILCSPMELGWGESHVGIMAFPDTMAVGTELAEFVPAEDHIIDIDNKSITHRPDLWGHYGFARELAAIFGNDLKPLETIDISEGSNLASFPLRIDDKDSCPGYCCLDIDGLRPAFSSLPIQYRLLSIGQRPINLLVDLTNYIMFELGQPMHAFDGERVRDIIVSPFGKKGTFRTLDSIDREMIPEDCMICDHLGPIALAGIMGGEETEVKENTTRVLLESANFNPARIRRTALRLGLRSEASQRFEKGQPQYHMALSIRRFVWLLRDAGLDAALMSQLTCAGETGENPRPLNMKKDVITRAIGMNISDKRISGILASLGFGCNIYDDELQIAVPPHRSKRDISIPNDIVEEVARIYGYDNVTPSMPQIEMCPYSFNTEIQKQHKIRRFLSNAKGYTEVHTYSWYDDFWLKRLDYDPGETLILQNPAAENNSRMRLELLPNLLALVESNSMHRDRFFLYEIGSVYFPTSDGCVQPIHIAGVGYQSGKTGKLQDLLLSVKGTIEEILEISNTGEVMFELSETLSKPWYAAGSVMSIYVGNKHIGHIGYLENPFPDIYEKGTQIVWFELNLDEISGAIYPDMTYESIPVYPGSWMDFSILAEKNVVYAELDAVLSKFSNSVLKKFKFLYLYDGKGLPEGKISYTFRFWLGLQERTLTGDDLSEFRTEFLLFLEKRGFSIR
ncbi:MAG: phenylalanine--tRNA ligase subunit beta [Candidatus Latescibacteria bacterium]|nr:phenylalanine--tRNA ligase subunit beta [Candidatus Latescibacterota bacterium]